MKILHTVQFYDPSIGGMQEVVKQLSERLVKLGHEVTVATEYDQLRSNQLINGVQIADFHISGNEVNGYNADVDEIKRYQNFLLYSDFDVITSFAAQQWATDLALPTLYRIKAKKVFVPTGFSGLYNPAYKNYFEYMKSWMKDYDMNVFLSDDYRDINFARENGISKIALIPNGAGEDEFLSENFNLNIRKKLGISENTFLILHVGSHTGAKGHYETIKIFERANIRDAVLIIVGNYFEPEKITISSLSLKQKLKYLAKISLKKIKMFPERCPEMCFNIENKFNRSSLRKKDQKRIIVQHMGRKETVSLYKESDLFLFPSNIECSPIVLFECMAAKTPFLVTDVGNSKEIICWCNSGVLLPTEKDKYGYSYADVESSIKILEELYNDRPKLHKMAETGFTIWKDRFSWEKIVKQYESLYS